LPDITETGELGRRASCDSLSENQSNESVMQAGLASRVWEIENFAALVEAKELREIEEGKYKRGKYQKSA
jgi:hypothetical protein